MYPSPRDREGNGASPAGELAAETTPADVRLHQLEAVTDTSLSLLSLEELLDEMLDRAVEFLSADTAAVLMLDTASRHLVAAAARGLEEEVHQGVRVPLGRGFAGRVAESRAPVAIDRVDASTVVNPILVDKGLRSMLGVPLLAGGQVLGVLHVGSLAPRQFTDADARLLQLVADRVALAVQARLAEADRTAARVLQRSLLPAELPTVSGLELAARYVPGDKGAVGGDWYDVFRLPSGSICLVVGDVAGHGLEAAHAMGRARIALRAYASETEQPARLLTKLDRHTDYFYPGTMVTVLCAVVEPALERVTLSVAGHPPPVLAVPGSDAAQLLDVPTDLPVGLPGTLSEQAPDRRTTTVALPPGAVFCAYTDGLVERRNRHLDHGLAELVHAVHIAPAEAVCAKVMAELIGSTSPEDDVALLVMHRHADAGSPGNREEPR